MGIYVEVLIAVVAFRLMHTAAKAEGRNVGLWFLVTLAWLAGMHWLLGGGGAFPALVATVASYSTMFAANLLGGDGIRFRSGQD